MTKLRDGLQQMAVLENLPLLSLYGMLRGLTEPFDQILIAEYFMNQLM